MNVLFCYKWERDPNEATITSDGALKWFDTKLKANDDEAAAIVMARQIAAETGGALTGVTIGDGDTSWVLARGAARCVCADAFAPDTDNAVTGARLAAVIKAAGEYDVILMGDTQEYSGVVAATAAALNIPAVVGVTKAEPDAENPGCILVERATSSALETLRVHTPALISVAATSSEKTHPTMRQMMAAKKLPVEHVELAEIGNGGRLGVSASRLPEKRRAAIIEGDARESAEKLVALMREKEIL